MVNDKFVKRIQTLRSSASTICTKLEVQMKVPMLYPTAQNLRDVLCKINDLDTYSNSQMDELIIELQKTVKEYDKAVQTFQRGQTDRFKIIEVGD